MATGRANAPRFEDVTETTGTPVTAEGASMMYTRYATGAELSSGRRVLEIACGGGNGLGLVASHARLLIGGDFSSSLLEAAQAHYGARFPLVRFSADAVPLRNATIDVVLFFEASYYVRDMSAGFAEIARVVRPGGTVLFVNANPERPDFIASPHSAHYHTADEFRTALGALEFDVSVQGAFPVDPPASDPVARFKAVAIGLIRQLIERIGLVPATLRGRARLKRIVYGRLSELPPELPPRFAPVEPRIAQGVGPVRGFKVLYVSAVKRPV
jgi:SAM-dependent methyltransferase